MNYELLAEDKLCETKPWCPSVHRADAGRLAIVGDQIGDRDELDELGAGPGECALLIDEDIVVAAADEIRRQRQLVA